MRLVSHRTRFLGLAALAVATIVGPIAASGCGRTACFVYTKAEYDAHAGSCPAEAKALPNFTDATCPGAVVSVDGPGIFNLNADQPDESLCCYPVTQRDIDPDFTNGECAGPNAVGGGGIGGSFGGGVAVSAGGGFGGCVTCGELLAGHGSPSSASVCSGQVSSAWQDVELCACAADSPCAKVCALNLCKDATISQDCRACLEDTATSGCDSELIGCKSD
jgi:hypothetical protein